MDLKKLRGGKFSFDFFLIKGKNALFTKQLEFFFFFFFFWVEKLKITRLYIHYIGKTWNLN